MSGDTTWQNAQRAVDRLLNPLSPKFNQQVLKFVSDYAVEQGRIRKTVFVRDLLAVFSCFPDTVLGAICREFNDSVGAGVMSGDRDVARMAEERRKEILENPDTLGGAMAAETGLLAQMADEDDEEMKEFKRRRLEAETKSLELDVYGKEVDLRSKDIKSVKDTLDSLERCGMLDEEAKRKVGTDIKVRVLGINKHVPKKRENTSITFSDDPVMSLPEGHFHIPALVKELGYTPQGKDCNAVAKKLAAWYVRRTGERVPKTHSSERNSRGLCYYPDKYREQASSIVHNWFRNKHVGLDE